MMDRSDRRVITFRPLAVALFNALLLLAFGSASAAESALFHWSPSPLTAADGSALPPAASYEVWLTRDDASEFMAASVRDTFYVLAAAPGCVYRLRIRAVDADGRLSIMSDYSDPFTVAAVSAVPSVATAGLGPVYPNPFNPATTIAYRVPADLPAGSPLSLEIIDLQGRRVCRLPIVVDPGGHEAVWRGRDDAGRAVPAGVYLARYVCGAASATTKLTLVR